MRLLVTRPKQDQEQTLKALKEMGLEGVCAPVMSVERLDASLPVHKWQAVIATSRNGLRSLKQDQLAPLLGLALFCVGRKTADLAKDLGFRNVKQVQRSLDGLADVVADHCQGSEEPVLYLSGVHRTGHLDEELAALGVSCHLHQCYETCPVRQFSDNVRHDIQRGFIDGVLLYSARTAQLFLDLIEQADLTHFAKNLRYYCLSQAVAAPIAARGYPLVVSELPNEASLLACAQNDHNYLR